MRSIFALVPYFPLTTTQGVDVRRKDTCTHTHTHQERRHAQYHMSIPDQIDILSGRNNDGESIIV